MTRFIHLFLLAGTLGFGSLQIMSCDSDKKEKKDKDDDEDKDEDEDKDDDEDEDKDKKDKAEELSALDACKAIAKAAGEDQDQDLSECEAPIQEMIDAADAGCGDGVGQELVQIFIECAADSESKKDFEGCVEKKGGKYNECAESG
jgi:ABC-type Zn2+ transport system substrate-binding protein/surface adhesin